MTTRPRHRVLPHAAVMALSLLSLLADGAEGQAPSEGEVRQLVTFRFVPGRAAEAMAVFQERALPLYRRDGDMLAFRAFREVESPVPLDLVVVSSFRGMAGMDASNEALRSMSDGTGGGIGAFYAEIGPLIAEHHDQFVALLPGLSDGDPATRRLVALVWYDVLPGEGQRFERALADDVVPWERSTGRPAATGRFLVSDGWDYLRVLGFDSLGDYQRYWDAAAAGHGYLDGITVRRREVILSPLPDFFVR